MKKLSLLFYVIIFIQFSLSAQEGWVQQNSGTTEYLGSVFFVNDNVGWAVGGSGSIVYTSDGGDNWIEQNSGTYNDLLSVYFTDSNTGWIVGSSGTILKTTDSGDNWSYLNSLTTEDLNSVYFIDPNNGWAVGGSVFLPSNATILKTTDGGDNWISQIGDSTSVFYSVYFTDVYTGWIVGRGRILKTTDSGENWLPILSYLGNSDKFLKSIYFTDSNTGWVVGSSLLTTTGIILKTTDGGDNWYSQSMGTENAWQSVNFIDSNTGWTVSSHGTIFKTIDGGNNWTAQLTDVKRLWSIQFLDEDKGWAVGDSGLILHTTNGGALPVELTTFTAQLNGSKVSLNWKTATELNNHGFEIQRNVNNSGWVVIGFIEGAGTTTEEQNYSFVDDIEYLSNGTMSYRLKQLDFGGTFEYSKIVEISNFATSYELSQNYPNPFNPSTIIKYQLAGKEKVQLKIYDVLGTEITTLVNEEKDPGSYKVKLNADNLPSGVYFYKLQAGEFTSTKKMLLVK